MMGERTADREVIRISVTAIAFFDSELLHCRILDNRLSYMLGARTKMQFCFFLLLLLHLFLAALVPRLAAANTDSIAYIRNGSERSTKLSWVNPNTGERVFMFELEEDDAEQQLNTFIGHEFELEEVGSCEKIDMCLVASFQVSKHPEQCKNHNTHLCTSLVINGRPIPPANSQQSLLSLYESRLLSGRRLSGD
jgi:hypothetical protein